MHKKGKSPLFPPIKTSAGVWCRDPVTKANAFASCWAAKNQLPAETHELAFCPTPALMCDLNIIRSRSARRELAKLRTDQATGPDHIGAIVLRTLA